jgi:hypothetical protein
MRLLKTSICSAVLFLTFSCSGPSDKNETGIMKEQPEAVILSLEKKWLDAEFNLDTATIAGLLHTRFISVNGREISGKQQELTGIYNNISAMRKDGIVLDSLRFEDAQVRLFDSTAIATFIVHSFKKDKGRPVEKLTRFYDVWIKRMGNWKAVSSQGTVLTENKSAE